MSPAGVQSLSEPAPWKRVVPRGRGRTEGLQRRKLGKEKQERQSHGQKKDAGCYFRRVNETRIGGAGNELRSSKARMK